MAKKKIYRPEHTNKNKHTYKTIPVPTHKSTTLIDYLIFITASLIILIGLGYYYNDAMLTNDDVITEPYTATPYTEDTPIRDAEGQKLNLHQNLMPQ